MRYRFTAILPVVFSLISPAAMAEGGFSKAALTAKAMHGDTQAQFDLCRLYQIEDSPNYAMPWCEKAAMNGNVPAQLQLAWLKVRNAENDNDLKKGYIWLSVALAQNHDFSGYNEWKELSVHFSKDKKSFRRLEKESNKFYKKYVNPHEERPVSALITESKAHYLTQLKQNAEKGDAESQALLGTVYEHRGEFALALEWYRKAAQYGYIDAQAYLGRSRSDNGMGALYDDSERYAWMSVALSQQYNYIDKLSLSLLGEKLGEEKLAAAQRMAQDYYKKSVTKFAKLPVTDLIRRAENNYMQKLIDRAQSGHSPSQYDLAQKYKSGIAILKDTTKSIEWHMKAAEGGSIVAQYTLAHMYEEGIELPKNIEYSAKWYKRAAMQGYQPAQFALGQLYFKNIKESDSNIFEAYAWLDIATRQGHPSADIARDAIAKSFDAEERQIASILSRKYYRLYVEPFQKTGN